MRMVALTLFLAACHRSTDIESSRLIGTWRPVPTFEQEADIRILARHACSGPIDPTIAIQRAIRGSTVTFEADGAWSSAFYTDQSATAPLRWKTIEDIGEEYRIWLSTSPSGPECTVSCEFPSPDELIVRDGLLWFTRLERVD